MNEICLPLTTIHDCDPASVEVRLPDTGREIRFKRECLKLTERNDSGYQVKQIRNTPEACSYVQLLYRQNR